MSRRPGFSKSALRAALEETWIEYLHLKALGTPADGRAAAVILNSGNANAATGEQGRADALRMCELTAQALGCATGDVLVCQTGLIGIPMPMEPVEAGVPKLGAQLSADAVGGAATDRLSSCLAEGATLVNYGAMSGEP